MYDGGGGLLNRKGIIPVFVVILTILIIMISMGYAALNKNLSISGEAFLRVQESVRITVIKLNTAANEGYETYIPEYSKKGIKLFTTFPKLDSEVIYAGEISNTTGIRYKVTSLNVTSTNNNIECTSSLVENSIIETGKTNFTITTNYKNNATLDTSNTNNVCVINYEFEIFDITPPVLEVNIITKSDLTATFRITATDEEGGSGLSDSNIYKYCLSNSSTDVAECTWKEYTSETDFTESVANSGVYYLFVYAISDNAGNVSDGKASGEYFAKLSISMYNEVQIFDYVGTEETFIVPITGYYKLEVWGGAGGNATGGTTGGTVSGVIGGYGGYATGIYKATKDEVIYVNVGGKGISNCVSSKNGTSSYCNGGYNGGGNGVSSDQYGYVSGGGGATHLAKRTGELYTLEDNKNDVLIVAGGGGGASYYNYKSAGYKGMGGSGGGMSGVSGYRTSVGNTSTTPGTQTSGAAFGKGVSSTASGNQTLSGGGGGYYGGKNSTMSGAAGGSGYIGNEILLSYENDKKHMYCYNCNTSDDASTNTLSNGTSSCISDTPTEECAKSGNGYAKITLLKTLSMDANYNVNEDVADITIDIVNNTDTQLSSENIYKYYISTSSTSLVGGVWKNYVPGVSFTESGIDETRYLWVYSISCSNGIINNGLTNKNIPYMITPLVVLPSYTYTGESEVVYDKREGWKIKFLTSGMLTLNDSLELDIFLVGGGSSSDFITGGTGGQTLTKTRNIVAGTYEIVIGNGGAEVKNSDGYYSSRRGENTTAFGITAEGGSLGGGTGSGGGCGNSAGSGYGGAGGSDGNAGGPTTGGNTCTVGRRGQGYTTREFGEPDGKLYAGGGGGFGVSGSGAGGAGGGGNSGSRGEPNTGGGGGAVYSNYYRTVAGGSGIVIIRNSRGKQAFDYDYTGRSILIDEGNGNWKLKFLTSGTLTTYENANIDVFLVGGGSSSEFITGGSGGQTLTESTSLPISSYDIVIGAGGTGKADGDGYYKSSSGGSSSAFGFTAIGGKPSGGTGSGGGCGNSAGSGYGGAGGSDGGAGGPTKGGNTCTVGRRGQGTTTREFGEPDGKLYAGGGGGFGVSGSGAGGAGGGGKGGSTGEINTGGGGGAVYSSKYRCVAGGSGIVIIRNQR